MKNILSLLVFFSIIQANAQHRTFIRLYNQKNQKISKGYLLNTCDSTIILQIKNKPKEINFKVINKIRMKRSAGLTALIVGGIPVSAGLMFFARNEEWDGLAGLVLFMQGMIAGPVAGGIKAVLNPKPLIINGEYEKWIYYKRLLDQKLK
jgi:hypothetical protein